MTCIVGVVDKAHKRVVIGGDSTSSAGCECFNIKDPKVFSNGDFVFGCTSSFRMLQLLQFTFKPPVIRQKEIYEYMCTDFITELRSCFFEHGYLQKTAEGDEKGGTFLVGYKDRLFEIAEDFHVAEYVNGIAAVGCGYAFALGALLLLSEQDMTAEDKALKALEISESLALGVKRPFVLISTQNKTSKWSTKKNSK